MRRLVIVVAILFSLSAPSAVLAQDGVQPDLPALMPTPADLADAGLTGFVAGVGTTGAAATLARFDAAYRGGDAYPLPDRTGMTRGGALILVRADDLESPSPDRVIVTMGLYVDEDVAAGVAEDLFANRAARDGAEASEVESPVTVTVAGPDPLGGEDWRQASAIGAAGSVVIEVSVEFTGTEEPDPGIAADLHHLISDRLDDDPAPVAGSPSLAVPEIGGDGIVPDLGRYILRGGEPVALAGEDPAMADARVEQFAGFATTGVYEYAWRTDDGAVSVGGYASGHETDDDARAYFRAIPDLLRSDGSLADVTVGNAIVPVGDSATLVTYGLAAVPDLVATELILRQDAVVVEIVVVATDEVTAAGMTALGRAAVDCVRDGDCAPVPLPAGLLSGN